jgi:3-hydroxyacyl-CoA dehydrogenase
LQNSPLSLSRRDGVAVVTLANPPVNALSQVLREALLASVTALSQDPSVEAILLTGSGRAFVGGADIAEMNRAPSEPSLPAILAVLETCEKPVVAAINGVALGGGLELALACDLRLAAPGTSLGLPETRLGIIPGAGGTLRLPRLVGLPKAIEMIGQARILKAEEAARLGLIDRVVSGDLLAQAVQSAKTAVKRRLRDLDIPPSDPATLDKASRAALKAAKGVPAVTEAVAFLKRVPELAFDEGLAQERAIFLRLRASEEAGALRHLFFAERAAQKLADIEGAVERPIAHVAVIGAGTMGSGIAVACADAGLQVLLLDRDGPAVAAGRNRIRQIYDRQVASGRLTAENAAERMKRIELSEDWQGLAQVDLAIEAVFEDMTVKAEVFRRLDGLLREGAILASNTSYLDLDAIAALTRRPQEVLGLHFFSPANVMRLLEVVRGARTAPSVLATGMAFARKLGKLPVVAGVCEGFIGNRIFALYRRAVEYLLEDGAAPEQIDGALERYGFAMGPFAVFDLAGLDIAWAMRKRRAGTRDPRERYVAIADRLCEAGRLGRKTGSGWYRYENGARQQDPAVHQMIEAERRAKGIAVRTIADEEIVATVLAVMANEAAKILAEDIAQRPSDIDLVMVNGYGFPSIKGGPLYAADRRGLAMVLEDLLPIAKSAGVGLEPAPLLIELAGKNSSFAAWQNTRSD